MPELDLPAHKQQNKQRLKTRLSGWAKRQGQQGDKTGWNAVTTPYLNHCNNYSALQSLQSAIATSASYLPSWSNSSFPVWGYESLISASQTAGSWTLLQWHREWRGLLLSCQLSPPVRQPLLHAALDASFSSKALAPGFAPASCSMPTPVLALFASLLVLQKFL